MSCMEQEIDEYKLVDLYLLCYWCLINPFIIGYLIDKSRMDQVILLLITLE